MNDGEGHCPFKQAVSAALQSLDEVQTAEQSGKWARLLSSEIENFAFHLPVYAMGSLVGVPRNMLHQTALWMSDFARCLAPASGPDQPDQMELGKVAAGHLMEMFRALLADKGARSTDGLLWTLAREAKRLGREDTNAIVANGIGFLCKSLIQNLRFSSRGTAYRIVPAFIALINRNPDQISIISFALPAIRALNFGHVKC